MAITDLTGTKWRLNDYIPLDALANFGGHETFRGTKYTVSFTSDYVSEHGQNYDEMYGEANSGGTPTRYALRYKVGDVAVPGPYIVGEGYPSGKWHNEGAKTIEITGGEDATNTNLIAWLQANATQIVDPPTGLYKFLDDIGLTRVFEKLKAKLDAKQDTLVSGTNIKTVNGNSLLGSGNIDIPGATLPELELGTAVQIATYKEGANRYRVFQKVIDLGALPNSTSKTVAHGIDKTKVLRYLSIQGSASQENFSNTLPLPFVTLGSESVNNNIYVAVGGNNITISTGRDRSAYNGTLTITYVDNTPIT